MEKHEIRTIQLIQLAILKNVIKICEDHNIRYFLIGGTLIGAIRHKGFIPWDDDIDIGMPRADYDAFIKIAQPELREDYFLQTYVTDPGYPFGYAKIRHRKTLFVEKAVSHLPISQGVYVDIFPLDGVPDNRLFAALQRIAVLLCESSVWKNINPEVYRSNNLLFNLGVWLLSKAFTLNRLRKMIDGIATWCSYDKQNYVSNYFSPWGKRELVPKIYYAGNFKMEFEGVLANIPVGYDLYLRNVYGDYMQLPPVARRVSHHEAVKVELHEAAEK